VDAWAVCRAAAAIAKSIVPNPRIIVTRESAEDGSFAWDGLETAT
jgi:hypothetical protein